METIEGQYQHKGDGAGGGEDDERLPSALRYQVKKKGEANGRQQSQRRLRGDGEGKRYSQQQDPLPIPQHDFSRRIERVRNRDRGKNDTKGAPSRDDRALHGRGALKQWRREHVEAEGDESSGVAEKAARHVPDRRSEQQSDQDEGHSGAPAPGARSRTK